MTSITTNFIGCNMAMCIATSVNYKIFQICLTFVTNNMQACTYKLMLLGLVSYMCVVAVTATDGIYAFSVFPFSNRHTKINGVLLVI